MTKPTRTTRGSGTPAGIEWVGGRATLPAYVEDAGEPYQPELLIWVGPDGAILGSEVVAPDELLEQACASLQDAIASPMTGPAHAPARVRVASPELAAALRRGHPSIEIVCAPTPELDALLAAMREHLGAVGGEPESHLGRDIGPEAMAALFRAAAALFRARPWKIVPGDACVFSVTIEALELRGAALSIIGQLGESLGLLVFPGLEDFHAFRDAFDAIERGEQADVPPHLALTFERGAELLPALRREIAEHGWEIAAPNAYPVLYAMSGGLARRPPTARDLAIAEAIAHEARARTND